MKFTANEDFRLGRNTFEAENTYTLEKYPSLTEADLAQAWEAGWCEVEGWDKAPERKPGAATVRPRNQKLESKRSEG
ncbi:hypothetical protein [Sediminicurvatus halobius]|uniref:Uncharacterized protein n=1 Tax=Sediminicurvatus halobius TaxID=2182432 RepID=A0A2U2MY07_9GAMM|nr:hypothetical protein [Spiribacter halobius]PWG61760.1 hypothetical protein DEM34_14945 [Spiribacter halobius]UEX76807.1 hypothetical protein LMH63_12665 [Spiribacter halobius]